MENINIPILWKFERTEEYISKCYHSWFTQRGKKKPLFYLQPIYDVFVFDRIERHFYIAMGKGLFDENVSLEAATKEYRNGFKKGYKEFTDKVRNDLRYNEGTIFKTATRFFSSVSWYPYTYKEGKIIPENWDILGENIGRFYAAWCIVLEYQDNFEPLFKKLYKPSAKVDEPERAIRAYQKAIDRGYMEASGNGYKWNRTKAQLGYFIRQIYNPDGCSIIPYKRLEGLFNETRLDNTIDKAINVKSPQKWRCKIDELITTDN